MKDAVRTAALSLALCLLLVQVASAQNCQFEYGMDYTGGYIRSLMVNSEQECCQACDSTYNCRAFTYWQETEQYNSYGVKNTCYLKQALGPQDKNYRVVTGRMRS